jgi:hypothetical protein
MNKPHKHAKEIIAWANGAEIEFRHEECHAWKTADSPTWNSHIKYRIKPQPVIKKMYMHYDSIEYFVKEGRYDGMNVPQQMYPDNDAMSNHLEFTFTEGKLTSVEIVK